MARRRPSGPPPAYDYNDPYVFDDPYTRGNSKTAHPTTGGYEYVGTDDADGYPASPVEPSRKKRPNPTRRVSRTTSPPRRRKHHDDDYGTGHSRRSDRHRHSSPHGHRRHPSSPPRDPKKKHSSSKKAKPRGQDWGQRYQEFYNRPEVQRTKTYGKKGLNFLSEAAEMYMVAQHPELEQERGRPNPRYKNRGQHQQQPSPSPSPPPRGASRRNRRHSPSPSPPRRRRSERPRERRRWDSDSDDDVGRDDYRRGAYRRSERGDLDRDHPPRRSHRYADEDRARSHRGGEAEEYKRSARRAQVAEGPSSRHRSRRYSPSPSPSPERYSSRRSRARSLESSRHGELAEPRKRSSSNGGFLTGMKNQVKMSDKANATRWQMAARAALEAGGVTAFRLRKEPGKWNGDKGAKVATAALGAAAIDAFIDKDPRRSSKGGGMFALGENLIGGLVASKLMGFKGHTKRNGRPRYGY